MRAVGIVLAGGNGKKMKELSEKGKYSLAEEEIAKIRETFVGYCCNEEETAENIRIVFHKHGYLMDTHTAVGYGAIGKYCDETESSAKIVLASTASPYKFAPAVYLAATGKALDGIEALKALEGYSRMPIPSPLCGLSQKAVLHPSSIDPAAMAEETLLFARS